MYLSFVSDLFQDCFHGQKTEFFVLRAHFCDKMNKFFILFLGEKAKTPPFRGFYHKKGGFLSKDVEDFTFPNIDIFGKESYTVYKKLRHTANFPTIFWRFSAKRGTSQEQEHTHDFHRHYPQY